MYNSDSDSYILIIKDEPYEVILKQDDYGAVMVEAGDRIELIRYMGGG